MTTSLDYFQVEQVQYIDEGSYSKIYAITDDLVIKIPKIKFYSLDKLIREFRICASLFFKGISVPEPKGVFNVGIGANYERSGFVMEWIKGTKGSKVNPHLTKRVNELLKQEVAKARSKGFIPVDADLHNSIYQEEEDRIYLIDFEVW